MINYDAQNIAIDDFSFCKRKSYYSILVDNDRGNRLEVISFRQQPQVIEILKKFKNVKTVTRDFAKSYKAAIREAFPKANQIVDRFHILKNLTDHINKYLKPIIPDRAKLLNPLMIPIQKKEVLNEGELWKIETSFRKWEIIKEVKQLKHV